jgi:hypothetical protein
VDQHDGVGSRFFSHGYFFFLLDFIEVASAGQRASDAAVARTASEIVKGPGGEAARAALTIPTPRTEGVRIVGQRLGLAIRGGLSG